MSSQSLPVGFHPVRRDQLRQEREHDSYKLQHKPAEPAACPDCGAIYHGDLEFHYNDAEKLLRVNWRR